MWSIVLCQAAVLATVVAASWDHEEIRRGGKVFPAEANLTEPCMDDEFSCEYPGSGRLCVPLSFQCDGDLRGIIAKDCSDGSDERNCTCPAGEFSCPSGARHRCFPNRFKCDGEPDCENCEDEAFCGESFGLPRSEETSFRCPSDPPFICISHRQRCDGRVHCSDGWDERNCSCPVGRLACEVEVPPDGSKPESGHKCVRDTDRCDGVLDCPGGWDERNCTCPEDQVACPNGPHRCLRPAQLCDGIRQCSDGWDETACRPCPEGAFACDEEGTQCVEAKARCDGKRDCSYTRHLDGWADEANCTCPEGFFQCPNSWGPFVNLMEQPAFVCQAAQRLCDGRVHCPDAWDELNCTCPEERPVKCTVDVELEGRLSVWPRSSLRGHECRAESERCDGSRDCRLGDDEEGCDPCPEGRFACGSPDPASRCVAESKRCDGRADCSSQVDEGGCACQDGLVSCLPDPRLRPWPTPGGVSICVKKCNGVRDCKDGSDEADCPCGVTELRCAAGAAKRCVRKSYQCDGDNDCGDWSDEAGCPCKAGKVPCVFRPGDRVKKRVCVPKDAVCDGFDDCGSKADERDCPSVELPTIISRACGMLPSGPPNTTAESVEPGQWPWLVSLRVLENSFALEHSCGGVLVAPDAVLTAKHCVRVPETSSSYYPKLRQTIFLRIHLNSHDRKQLEEREVVAGVAAVHLFPSKRGKAVDMSLVRLRRPIAPPSATICLPKRRDIAKTDLTQCWFAGWGRCFVYGDLDGEVTQSRVDATQSRKCRRLYNFDMSRGRLCAYGRNKRPFCPGDSGGPLMCVGPDQRWRVLAVAIAKKRNCRSRRPELSGLFESVGHRLRKLKGLLRQPSYRGHERFPIPLRKPRRTVHFRSQCAFPGSYGQEPFVACVLPNGTEVRNGTEWRRENFVYACVLSNSLAKAVPTGCIVNGSRLAPGESVAMDHFRLFCAEERTVSQITDAWVRLKIEACWDPHEEISVQSGGQGLSNLTCSIGLHGHEGKWLSEDGDVVHRISSLSSDTTVVVTG